MNAELATAKEIMVVDDSMTMRELITIAMQGHSITVLTASNGKEALDILSKKKVNLIITDLNMPIMNGYELVKAVRGDTANKTTPILALTSDKISFDLIRECGATGFLLKPSAIPEIQRRINLYIE